MTIMFGLAFAMLLTLVVVPLLYAVLFGMRDFQPLEWSKMAVLPCTAGNAE